MKTLFDPGQAAKVAKQLSRWVTSQSPKTAARRGGRIQLVSPSLCHDALQRLGPSLQAHHGCDLIDINPGTCLWSRHLHDVVKPRRHILVEPEREAFDEFITPLIEEDPIRYGHAETLSEVLDASNRFLSQGVIESRIAERRSSFNYKILMTVNTSRPVDTSLWSGSKTGYFVNDYYTSFWGLRTDIHRYGLVRVLAWVPEPDKSMLVPRTVEQRSRQTVQLEATSSVSEIAGTGWSRGSEPFDRPFNWPDLVSEAAHAVRAEETAKQIQTPNTRRGLPPWPPSWSLSLDLELLKGAPAAFHTSDMQEFLELDDKLKIDDPQWRSKALHGKSMPRSNTSDQKRWRGLLRQRRLDHGRYQDTAGLVGQQRNLEQRWRHQLLRNAEHHVNGSLAQLKEEADRIKNATNKLKRPFQAIGKTAIDDFRAYDSRPQALAWNQRQYEPLLAQTKEFAPARPLSLIDITPSPDFRRRLTTEDECEIFDFVVCHLWQRKIKNDVHSALTALLQAGVEGFVETCPALKDPVQGGWYDLTGLRLRSLPAKVYLDIALAWAKWPFRPPLRQLLPAPGANSRFRDLHELGI